MQKNILKKIASLSIISLFSFQLMYIFVEPTVATAATASHTVIVTLNVTDGLTITTPADVVMSPNIGIGANSSIGSAAWTVVSNGPGGYNLAVKASASPALARNGGGDSFADYTESSAGVPETWSVASSAKEFGYSGYGTDVNTTTWGSYSSCGSGGTPAANSKYLGFKTNDNILATRSGVTPPAGITTNICFAAQQNGVFAASGVYNATITATATSSS